MTHAAGLGGADCCMSVVTLWMQCSSVDRANVAGVSVLQLVPGRVWLSSPVRYVASVPDAEALFGSSWHRRLAERSTCYSRAAPGPLWIALSRRCWRVWTAQTPPAPWR